MRNDKSGGGTTGGGNAGNSGTSGSAGAAGASGQRHGWRREWRHRRRQR
jgi:hypothetical protein